MPESCAQPNVGYATQVDYNMAIVTRASKVVPLTHQEMDSNLIETAAKAGTWRADFLYPVDSMTVSAGVIYRAQVTNLNKIPASNPVEWAVYNPSHSHGFADLLSAVKNEPTMISNSPVHVPTQASVKAYVDSQVGGLGFTVEQAQDAIGTILAPSVNITFTYSDATPSISAVVTTSTTNVLLGRHTAGAGTAEEISIGAGLTLTANVLSASVGSGSGIAPVVASATGPTPGYDVITGVNSIKLASAGGGSDVQSTRFSALSADIITMDPGPNAARNCAVISGSGGGIEFNGINTDVLLGACNDLKVVNSYSLVAFAVSYSDFEFGLGTYLSGKNIVSRGSNEYSVTHGRSIRSQLNSRVYGYSDAGAGDPVYTWPIGGPSTVTLPAGFAQNQETGGRAVSEPGATANLEIEVNVDNTPNAAVYDANGICEAWYITGTVTGASAYSDPVATAGAAAWELKWLIHVTAPAGGYPVTMTVIGTPTITKVFSSTSAASWTVALGASPVDIDVTGDATQLVVFNGDFKINRVRVYEP